MKDCDECEVKEGIIEHIEREIELGGDLTQVQSDALMQIADQCPVHRTLTGRVTITTRRADIAAVAQKSGSV